ncbi:MAG: hypothetical protein JST68_14705 [Bacteroidetes bacterium]|nr:hypothetical protein [Bacteroidota bacterium]
MRNSFLLILLILLFSFAIGAFSGNKRVRFDVSNTQVYDTSGIRVNPKIRDFKCYNDLIQELLLDKNGLFQHPMFRDFFTSVNTQLIFSEGRFPMTKGGISGRYAKLDDSSGIFSDTIYLNDSIFLKASREYLVSVVLHECLHDYITWVYFSFSRGQNRIDSEYLIKHFPVGWEQLTGIRPSNAIEHDLIADNFIEIFAGCFYPYTDTRSGSDLRKRIAKSLAWGGLFETKKWKEMTNDSSCYIHHVDVWSRNLDGAENTADTIEGCKREGISFLRALHLQPVCK